jgi:hypothetical protein
MEQLRHDQAVQRAKRRLDSGGNCPERTKLNCSACSRRFSSTGCSWLANQVLGRMVAQVPEFGGCYTRKTQRHKHTE